MNGPRLLTGRQTCHVNLLKVISVFSYISLNNNNEKDNIKSLMVQVH